jgi:hypothetical protein
MKTGAMVIWGSLLLLGCMIFALAKLDSADKWVAGWIPFVAAGVALVFFGAILQTVKGRQDRIHRT